MTPDEILAMAKEAGLTDPDLEDWVTEYGHAKDEIIMFAKLVAAKEREACAQAALAQGRSWDPHALDPRARIAAAIRARRD